jgi:hypothetical protein
MFVYRFSWDRERDKKRQRVYSLSVQETQSIVPLHVSNRFFTVLRGPSREHYVLIFIGILTGNGAGKGDTKYCVSTNIKLILIGDGAEKLSENLAVT